MNQSDNFKETIPVGELGIIALESCSELGQRVNDYIVSWRKGTINESVRGKDLYLLVDVTNYNIKYSLCGYENRMSPDDHFADLKRIISAAAGKARRINVIMPFLYESRQHKRSKRESLDCALALKELHDMGVENILTFDAHDPRVQNAIPSSGFDNVQPTYQCIKARMKGLWAVQFTMAQFLVLMWVCSTRDVTTQQLSMAATRLLLMSIWVHPWKARMS